MSRREIPTGFEFWPRCEQAWSPAEVQRMYSDHFAGAWRDRDAHDRLCASLTANGEYASAENAIHAFGLAENGKDGLWLLFPAVDELYPSAFPGPAQERGDCVSHSSRNAALASLCTEILHGEPDEHSGRIEGPPEVSASGIANGVLSSEYLYWWRGYDSDGWDCATAAEMIRAHGLLLRKQYDELALDLTEYSGSLAGKFGHRRPPNPVAEEGRLHVVRTVTECQRFEEIRDLLANGYGVSSCGSEGFADERDANGVSRRSGSWAHAMAYLGVDDRPETRQLYGEPLVLVLNSWGSWNRGPRRVRGTQAEIPAGSFWAKWSDVSQRYAMAYSSVAGWPRKRLPDYGFEVLG